MYVPGVNYAEGRRRVIGWTHVVQVRAQEDWVCVCDNHSLNDHPALTAHLYPLSPEPDTVGWDGSARRPQRRLARLFLP